jgi:hypothetical protein
MISFRIGRIILTFLLVWLVELSLLAQANNSNCIIENGDIVVTNNNDLGPGSLRAAIECANAIPGPNRIIFRMNQVQQGAIQYVIFVGSSTGEPLPPLSDAGTIIDATTQAGSTERPRIVIDGRATRWNLPVNGLFISGDNCEIYGLEIRYFPDDGIDIFGANNVKIGAPRRGNVIYGCGEERDFYEGANPTGPYEGCGIVLRNQSQFCQIKSNLIGTDRDFNPTLGNEFCGISVQGNSNNNVIGGSEPDAFNIIAFNPVGVRVENSISCAMFNNAIFCNKTAGISLRNGGNRNHAAPIITTASNQSIAGTAAPNDFVEIFANTSTECNNDPCQGRVFIGRVIVARDSTWQFNVNNLDFGRFDIVTATATDPQGNTSSFANCRRLTRVENTCSNANGVIVVSNTNDDGPGSLRAAIDCANSVAGANTIRFNIPGNGRHIIYVGSTTGQPLPTLTDARTIIDGSTQSGFGNSNNYEPKIVLDGSRTNWDNPYNAIFIRGNACEIYALEIRNFPDDGIDVTGVSNVIVGAPNKGNVIYNCGIEQDFFPNATPTGPWEGCGIVLKGGVTNTKVSSNIIGTNYNRTLQIGNENCGIYISRNERNNTLGGNTAAEGNIIAYNPTGIELSANATQIAMRNNIFICNDTIAIALRGNANASKRPPTINEFINTLTGLIAGTAQANDRVDVYIANKSNCVGKPCQGEVLLGTVTANANGRWTLPLTTQIFALLSPNISITALATDQNGNTSAFADCFNTQTVSCDGFRATIAERRNATCNIANGAFTVAVNGGQSPYRYNIGNGATFSPNFNNLSSGTYSITITDANGCETTQATAISNLEPPSVFIVDEVAATCGQASGAFTVLAFGGISPFQYNIGDGFTNNNRFERLSPGTYEITLSDASGCQTLQTVTVEEEEALKLTIDKLIDASCGLNNGRVEGILIGGIEPILYQLGTLSSNAPRFGELSPGEYTMTALDANGCSASHNFTIDATPPLLLNIANIKNADCAQRNGQITVNVTGGTSPVRYNFGNGVTANPVFSNLAAGVYFITATDANGCTAVQSARIEASENLLVEITNIRNASCDENNGTFTVRASNGRTPYRYDIGNGSTTNPAFTNLEAGNYKVTITDAAGCNVIKEVNIEAVPPLTLNLANIVNATCNTGVGAFTLFASGGTLPITYALPGAAPTSNPSFTNLPPGNYTVTARDANGCEASELITITLEGTLNIRDMQVTDATCGKNNGSVQVRLAPPTSNVQITFNYTIGNQINNNGSFTNLAAGNYEVTVTSSTGCTTTRSITIGQTTGVASKLVNKTVAECGQSNANFTIEVTEGSAPFQYSIGINNQNTPTFRNLSGGLYVVTITDANSCTATQEIEIEETPPLTISVVDKKAATCGKGNGGFAIQVLTGTAPYIYAIGNSTAADGRFENLTSGTFQVDVIDRNGCTVSETVAIEARTITLDANITNITPSTCDKPNGSFRIEGRNGTAPYQFTMNGQPIVGNSINNLATGTYQIIIEDAAGCTGTKTVTIENGGTPVSAIVGNIKIAECGQSIGSFTIVPTTGKAPYSYDIGLGDSSNPTFDRLGGGTYSFTVTDANGCEFVDKVIINETPPITISIANQTDAKCGLDNGTFDIVVNTGTPPYSYNIGNGVVPNPSFSNLQSGIYIVTVTDANFCTTTARATIDEGLPLSANISEKTVAKCGTASGGFTVQAVGGTAPYTYRLGGGVSTNGVFTGLSGGIYQVSISDSKGCIALQTVQIEETSQITARLVSRNNATCGQRNGSLEIAVTGGQGPFTYTIGDRVFTQPTLTELAAGNYVIIIKDAFECSIRLEASIEDNANIQAGARNVKDDFCNNNQGAFDIVPSGGQAPYTFTWVNGTNNNGQFRNIGASTYAITTTDATGCRAVTSVTVNKGTDLSLRVLNQQEPTCGGNNGIITVSAVGGKAPYTFNIGNGATTSSTFNGLSPKTYTVRVIDDNGCVATLEVELKASAALSLEIVNKLDVSCRQSNGSFTAEVRGGVAPYTYSIGGAESTNATFNNLAQGNYTLTVKDKNGCSATQNVVINGVADLTVTIENLQNASCDKLNGQFTVQARGGTAPYSYNLGSGVTNNPTFTNLAKGTYTVTVTDSRNCQEVHVATVAEAAPIQANIVNRVAANCGEAKGAFTVLVNGGTTPYQYNIGSGATANNRFENLASGSYNLTITDGQGCTFQTAIEVTGTTAPTLTMGALVAANCGQNNGAVTINAQGGRAPYTFNIGSGAGVNPTFQNLAASTYQVAVMDANGCSSTISFTIPSEGGDTPVAKFLMDSVGLMIELVAELVDNENITWDLGDGTTYDEPTITHEYKLAGEYKICLTLTNPCGSDTYCQSVTLKEVKAVASLRGLIMNELEEAIAKVTVKQQAGELEQNNMKTAEDGIYAFPSLPIGESYKIVPERRDNLLNGISTYDLFLINNHILTTQPLDSPYKIIAADIDGSGAVTTFDIVSLRKVLLGIANEFPDGNPSWRFIDASFKFPNPKNPFSTPFPEYIEINPLTGEVAAANFIGVKVGDVNNSAVLSRVNSLENRALAIQPLLANYEATTQEISIDVPDHLIGLQFTLEIDPSYATISDVTIGNLVDLSLANFGLHLLEKGKITVSWDRQSAGRGNRLMTVKLKILRPFDAEKVVQITSSITPAEVYSGTAASVQIQYPTLNFANSKPKLVLYPNTPNPFDEFTQIHFDLPQASNVVLTLMDEKGRVHFTQKQFLQAGVHSIPLELNQLPSGVLYYRLSTEKESTVGKMIKIK